MSKKDNVVPIGSGMPKSNKERVDAINGMLDEMSHVRGHIVIDAASKKSLHSILGLIVKSHDRAVDEGKELPYGSERMYDDAKAIIEQLETVGLDCDDPLDVPVSQLAFIDTLGVMMGQPSQVVPGLTKADAMSQAEAATTACPKEDQVFTAPKGNDTIH